MSTCRSCGAKIHWIELESGKKMPCDPELITTDEAEPGDVLVTVTGKTIKIPKTDELFSLQHTEEGYVSHFSTCPQADEWRKK